MAGRRAVTVAELQTWYAQIRASEGHAYGKADGGATLSLTEQAYHEGYADALYMIRQTLAGMIAAHDGKQGG